MKMKNFLSLVGILLVSGCVSAPMRSGFLSNYEQMQNKYDLDAVRESAALDLNSYDTLYLAPVETKLTGDDLEDGDKKLIVSSLEKNFRMEMAKYFKNVTSDKSPIANQKALRLELALTELKPTDVAENLIIGFGVGNATASIEGHLVDSASGKELIAFMDRKKGSPFTKKEFDATTKFPNWSELQYLYLFTEIWPENVGKIIAKHKNT